MSTPSNNQILVSINIYAVIITINSALAVEEITPFPRFVVETPPPSPCSPRAGGQKRPF